MGEVITWIVNFFREFRFFAVVLPWERAVRVRFGSRVKLWGPGWHFRLPFADEIILLNTRLRIADTGSQTLTTRDGHTITVGTNIGFRISDPLKALLTMQQPENSCAAIAGSCLAALVSETDRSALNVALIEAHVLDALKRETAYDFDFVRVRDFAYARTIRLLQESCYRSAAAHIEERKI